MATSRQREEEMLKKQITGQMSTGQMSTDQIAKEVRPRNEIELLQHQLERAKDRIDEQNEELLSLYRRLHGCDSPSRY